MKGFTLIEIIIVLLLISIIFTMATLAIDSDYLRSYDAKTTALRWQSGISALQMSAIINNTPYRVVMNNRKVTVERFRATMTGGQWTPYKQTNILRLLQVKAPTQFNAASANRVLDIATDGRLSLIAFEFASAKQRSIHCSSNGDTLICKDGS